MCLEPTDSTSPWAARAARKAPRKRSCRFQDSPARRPSARPSAPAAALAASSAGPSPPPCLRKARDAHCRAWAGQGGPSQRSAFPFPPLPLAEARSRAPPLARAHLQRAQVLRPQHALRQPAGEQPHHHVEAQRCQPLPSPQFPPTFFASASWARGTPASRGGRRAHLGCVVRAVSLCAKWWNSSIWQRVSSAGRGWCCVCARRGATLRGWRWLAPQNKASQKRAWP